MKNLTKANEDYLEAIYIINQKNGFVKSVRIAEFLNVSRPAVNKAMNELMLDGLITKESYANVVLTDEGTRQAQEIYQKHLLIKEFLLSIGVSEETAEIDCCKLEHVLSEETVSCMISKLEKKD